jgi:DNA-binding LacI/PurR family transcriptional regulator
VTSRARRVRPPAGRPVTMNDVAAAAGVAQSTVSRILNDTPLSVRVSPATRERVLAIADELGYRPHPIARALRGAPTMLMGAIIRDITDWFFAATIEALTSKARDYGYSVVLAHAAAAADEALRLTAVLEARHCDAILVLGDFRGEARLVEDLRNARVPVIGLWQGSEERGRPFPVIGVDNDAGIRAAARHLTELGHERIAYVGADRLGDMEERQAAFLGYLDEIGGDVPSDHVQLVPNTIDGARLALSALLERAPRPTAIIAASDVLALGLNRAAYDRGLVVPADLSIVGFDDIPQMAASVPGLTTVRMPIPEMVDAGLEIAVGDKRWDGEGRAPRVIFQPSLVVRQSTAAPASAD